MKEKLSVTISGDDLLEKVRELRQKEKELMLLNKSKLMTVIFERYYDERIKNKETTGRNNARVV